MNGHTDVLMGGAMLNNDDVYTRLKFLQNCIQIKTISYITWIT